MDLLVAKPGAVNVLMSTCTVNLRARIYLSPQFLECPSGPPTYSFRWPGVKVSSLWHPSQCQALYMSHPVERPFIKKWVKAPVRCIIHYYLWYIAIDFNQTAYS